jgi:hypothetical protein
VKIRPVLPGDWLGAVPRGDVAFNGGTAMFQGVPAWRQPGSGFAKGQT